MLLPLRAVRWYVGPWLQLAELVADYLEDPGSFHGEVVDAEDVMP